MSGFALTAYHVEVINGQVSSIDATLTISSRYGGSYDKPFQFKTTDTQQRLKISIKSPEVGPGGKKRFYIKRLEISEIQGTKNPLHSLEFIHPASNQLVTRHGPDILYDLPEHTNAFTLVTQLPGKSSFYLAVIAQDRNQPVEVKCDPQVSNDPEIRLEFDRLVEAVERGAALQRISIETTLNGAIFDVDGIPSDPPSP